MAVLDNAVDSVDIVACKGSALLALEAAVSSLVQRTLLSQIIIFPSGLHVLSSRPVLAGLPIESRPYM